MNEEAWDPRDPAYDSYEPEPRDPEIIYKAKDLLFDYVGHVWGVAGYFFTGKPAVGGGSWVLCWDDEIPDEYQYQFYGHEDVDLEDRANPDNYASWATDVWLKRKDQIGSGVIEYEEAIGGSDKILFRITPELRDFLVPDIEDAMSDTRGIKPGLFIGHLYNQRKTISSLEKKGREEIKKVLWMLDKIR